MVENGAASRNRQEWKTDLYFLWFTAFFHPHIMTKSVKRATAAAPWASAPGGNTAWSSAGRGSQSPHHHLQAFILLC